MLTIKTLSVLTVILMANVSTAIASQDNKDDNTNTSDTLNLSGSLSLSTSSASDANYSSDAYAEGKPYCNIITSTVQKEPFVCYESMVKNAEDQSQNDSFINDAEVIVGYMSLHTDNTNN